READDLCARAGPRRSRHAGRPPHRRRRRARSRSVLCAGAGHRHQRAVPDACSRRTGGCEEIRMFISGISLPRRTFLRGMGAAVGLPFLEAMLPAFKASAAPATPRFGAVFVPNGAIVEQWIPQTAGTAFDLPPILAPLAKYRDTLVVVSNLTRAHPGVVEGDHA